MKITIETEVSAPPKQVWDAWVNPDHITKWNFAIDEWCCPRAEIDLKIGGTFKYRMEAKDGSFAFDFEGVFTKVAPQQSLHFKLGDDRIVTIEFLQTAIGTRVSETFEAEDENTAEQQRQGWQSILNNFKKHVETQNS
ncbi:MAG: SRPBCC family protein [Methylophilus sp.]|nr:SRPBCC family protein [Methylophilus sp.]